MRGGCRAGTAGRSTRTARSRCWRRSKDAPTRYTAGQRVLGATGNLKAVQALLGHASISTTADTYTDWDVQQLESSLLQTFAAEEKGE